MMAMTVNPSKRFLNVLGNFIDVAPLFWHEDLGEGKVDRRSQDGRKVRTPYGNVAGNARPPRGEDKCNRKNVQVML